MDAIFRRASLLLALAGLGASRTAAAQGTASGGAPMPPPAGLPTGQPTPTDASSLARSAGLVGRGNAWQATTHGEIASAYLNVIPTFRQSGAAEGTVLRTVQDELRERVSFTQFLTQGRSPGAAIAAAIEHVWRNNGNGGGEVVLPPGAPIIVTEPIPARPGVLVRGPRRILVPPGVRVAFGLFDVDGTDEFAIADLDLSLSRRAGPAIIRGSASGFSARGLRVHAGRSIWFERGMRARISDLICFGGTSAIGLGTRPSDLAEDIVVTGLQAYDMLNEAVDINYNVNGFKLQGFTFRRVSLRERGEAIDIGGGECRDISISNGLIDCSGSTFAVSGIRTKLGTQNLKISNVDIRNGESGGIGILLDTVQGVVMDGVNIDGTFARGFFASAAARDVVWRSGRCDSPIHVNGATDVDIDVTHDGGGTDSTRPAITVSAGARRVVIRGMVRDRPRAPALRLGEAQEVSPQARRGLPPTPGDVRDCAVLGLRAIGVERGIEALEGCERLRVSDLLVTEAGREAVWLGEGCRNLELRGLMAVDYSRDAAGAHAALRIGGAAHGSLVRDVVARDTRTAAARTGGAALEVAGPSEAVLIDGIIADGLPGPVQIGLDRLTGSSVGPILRRA